MKRRFVEVLNFREKADEIDPQDLVMSIQNTLQRDPEHGDLIPGTGGMRKMRAIDAFRGKGKRGGFRVIYLDFPHAGVTFLLDIYGKGQKIDISSDEKKMLRELAKILGKEVSKK